MRSNAWLATSGSRRLRDTLATAPGLLAHASVTETIQFCPMGPTLRYTAGSDEERAGRISKQLLLWLGQTLTDACIGHEIKWESK
jgi:hypothetical protein